MAIRHPQHAASQPILPLQAFDALALRALAIAAAKILIPDMATSFTGNPPAP
jgi:hypothetical protein